VVGSSAAARPVEDLGIDEFVGISPTLVVGDS